jgi:CBS-domain-containing membrane protein
MSKDLVTVTKDMDAHNAASLMAKHQIRRLPVVDGDKLVGIISLGDFAVHHLTDEKAGRALSEISETNNQIQH